ncbi:hypothetical protein LCGC14_2550260, partial [marine sediment metagenome]
MKDLVDEARKYTALKKVGWPWSPVYRGKCPFHKETTPSFFVEPRRQLY